MSFLLHRTQSFSYKDSLCSKEPKSKDPKSAPSHDNVAETAKKKNRKDKKKKLQNHRRKQNKQPPATDANTEVPKKKKKIRDPSEVTSFNCDKKSHYASDYTDPPKN